MPRSRLLGALIASALASSAANAAIDLIAIGTLSQVSDLSGLTGLLENGVDHGNVLGGIGSGLAWAGGTTFLALPDRGPNATTWSAAVDNTTSYISRFQTVDLQLTKVASGGLPYTLTPSLQSTTLLYSSSALTYGPVSTIAGAKNYFNGRSDNFTGTGSLNSNFARLDPEAIRVANDGRSVYVSDEYGPYVYRFDRVTGARTAVYTLPSAFNATNLSAVGATEISGNTTGRVANKGMEGLAITPDGSTLYGFEQSPLIQDGGDGGRYNRIVKIDVATHATSQYVYDNRLQDPAFPTDPTKTKTYNSSEILALNDHQFLVLERDGKGLGDAPGSKAVVKRIYEVDLSSATDIGALNGGAGISGATNLAPYAVTKTLFLDVKANLVAHGIADTAIPAKIEGMAFGQDIVDGGVTYHTLYLGNDNDFVPGNAGDNKFFVFRFSDADLAAGSVFQNQNITAVPEPGSYALMAAGLLFVGGAARRVRRN